MKTIYYFIILLLPVLGYCQNFDGINPVFIKNGKVLRFPFTGGIKNPMFSNIDLNDDGKKDLFVFDKEGEVIMPFLYTGENPDIKYTYAPEYITNFPKLRNFALLVDYNHDGVEDIFTGGFIPSTVEVYKGSRINGQLQFQLVEFNFPGSLGNFLQIFQGGFSQVYVSNIDVPAIADVDNDGDLDIVAFPASSDKLTYYENLSKDENLGRDSLKFRINTMCWGGFKEDDFSSQIFLSSGIDDCYNFRSPEKGEVRHSGSTTLLLDMDGDGDMDALLGDLSNPNIKLLINHGTNKKAWINEVDHFFPEKDISAHMEVFLAAYHVDVNNDGKRDLIITPNDRNDSERSNHIWLYLNHGEDKIPDFRLFTKSFLIDQTLSMGSGSHPCFLDYNADGLTDLLIGGNGIILPGGGRRSWMELYINTGTAENPEFTLANDDFLEFSKFANPTLRLAPSVGDLDGDGDIDLFIGDFTGRLFYYENMAGKGNPMEFMPRVYPYKNIFVGNNSKPAIFDANGDGLQDIIIGEVNNELNYLQNIGSIGFPDFIPGLSVLPNTRNLGKVFPEQNNYFLESGSPYIIQTENGVLLALGSQGGPIRLFEVTPQSLYNSFPLESEDLGNFRVGSRTVPALEDIDNDGYFEICIGNERGGISFYNTTLQKKTVNTKDIFNDYDILFYPNPAYTHFEISGIRPDKIEIISVHGQRQSTIIDGNIFRVDHMKSGMYFVSCTFGHTKLIKKLVVVPNQ